jgi:hypothetical protein
VKEISKIAVIIKNVLIIGVLVVTFGLPSWTKWLGVLVLIPLLYFFETGGKIKPGNEEDPGGNDNQNRKFIDYM